MIRGNSASGQSTVAAALQRRFDRGTCAVVAQDVVRREMVRESDEAGAFNIALIEHIARLCLSRGLVVVVQGIVNADRYAIASCTYHSWGGRQFEPVDSMTAGRTDCFGVRD
ncbi:adenylyl-sulfate kinase [Nocardia sp. CA-129566]|uniref:adenylyl-sulfate kinase n=1 Tax=Nocardia sp. CA-129566 TaxID=3239976 RepID=UPI003D964639